MTYEHHFFKFSSTIIATIVALTATVALTMPLIASAQDAGAVRHPPVRGMVYTLTNATAGNRVVAFERWSDGRLIPRGSFRTGGNGTGSGLGNSGALSLSDSGNWLLAVNPGSDSVSVFLVFDNFLLRTDTTGSGGAQPVSVTIKGNIVYVLNAGSDNLAGFRLNPFGHLSPIPHSQRPLSGTGTGAAQVEFNRAGDLLAVTEKATSKVLTYAVDGNGLLGEVTISDSPGTTPFGFAFGRRDQMFVSEADGGAPGGSTVSSYQLTGDGHAQVITAALPDKQSAACWVAVTREGDHAYVTNTASGNLSLYGVSADGQLQLIDDVVADDGAGSAPTDLALDRTDGFLYVLNPGHGTISAFAVGADGSLQLIENEASDLLSGASTGLVAH